jgi:hypothetical protein
MGKRLVGTKSFFGPVSVTEIIDEPLESGIPEATMDAFANPHNSLFWEANDAFGNNPA